MQDAGGLKYCEYVTTWQASLGIVCLQMNGNQLFTYGAADVRCMCSCAKMVLFNRFLSIFLVVCTWTSSNGINSVVS